LSVLLDVAVVEALDRRVAEDEDGQGAAADGVDGGHPAGGVVDDDVQLVPGRRVQRHRGDVDARVANELGLGPEGQAAGGRVQPVGVDDQVEPARPCLLERDVHAAMVLAQGGDMSPNTYSAGPGWPGTRSQRGRCASAPPPGCVSPAAGPAC
jgi:hypothetical protein